MKKTLLCLLAMSGLCGYAQAAGTASDPISVDALIEQGVPASPVADVYVQGYIVGWVDGTKLQSGAMFTVPCTVASNILLAGSSSETDVNYMIPVQLPSGSIRSALNLVDNPENLGHEVILCGSNEKYFGANGLKSVSKYEWVGEAPVHVDVEYGPEVTGTAENPLTVEKFFEAASAGTSIPNTYLKGVIVGYVPGQVFDDAVLSAEGEEVSQTNILVAATANPASLEECVPVQLPFGDVRTALNLKDNPDNLGKTVTLLGTHTPYFGHDGLKEVSAFAFGDEEVTPPTPAEDNSFYHGLVNNADDWSFEDINLAEGLSYVWSWKSNYSYLNASAYVGGPKAAEAIAYSPVLDLTDKATALVSFEHAAKFQTNLRTDCKLVVRVSGQSDYDTLTIPTWPEAGAWTFVNSGAIDLNDYCGKKVQLGLKYVSTSSAADTWEIKNFVVEASAANGVAVVADDVNVSVVNGNIVAPAGAQVYNLNGVAVGTEGLANGLYIVVVGDKAVKVVVK